MRWAVGITTVEERLNTLLPDTLESLERAGFDQPYLFIDGWTTLTAHALAYEVTMHSDKVGQLRNWISALVGLYTRYPDAERYAIFEDDLLACCNLKRYLERCPYPSNGYLNLLTHDQNLAFIGPNHGWHQSNQLGRGAVGLVFDRVAAEALLRCGTLLNRPRNHTLMQAADGAIINGLGSLGFKEWVHNPSLLQHVGEESTLGHDYGRVMAWKGEHYDPLTLLEHGVDAYS